MNPQDEAVLKHILTKNPQDLTMWDRGFINARRGYLNDEQKRIFASVLVTDDGSVPPPPPTPEKTNYTNPEEPKAETPVEEQKEEEQQESNETQDTTETENKNPYDDSESKDPDAK